MQCKHGMEFRVQITISITISIQIQIQILLQNWMDGMVWYE